MSDYHVVVKLFGSIIALESLTPDSPAQTSFFINAIFTNSAATIRITASLSSHG